MILRLASTVDLHRQPSGWLGRLRAIGAAAVIATGLASAAVAHAQETQLDPTTISFRYDGAGRPVAEIGPDPDGTGPLRYPAKRTTYDPTGLVVKVETGELNDWFPTNIAPNAWTGFTVLRTERMTYDTLNQLVKTEVIGSDGMVVSVTQANYYQIGRPGCTAVRMDATLFNALPDNACTLSGPNDRIAQNIYDAAGQVLKVRRAVGTPLQQDYASYTYSANGKQTSMSDARGYKATFVYDGFDRQVAWIFPSKTTPGVSAPCNIGPIVEAGGIMGPTGAYSASDDCEKYSYDRSGNRARFAKRDGSVLTYTFDNINRVTAMVVPTRIGLDDTYTRDVFYTYDLRHLTTSVRFDSASGEGITTDYDGFGRIIATSQIFDGNTRSLTFLYDANGNRKRITHPDTAFVTYDYDRLNRPTLIQRGGVNPLRGYTYTPRGSLDSESVGGGLAGSNSFGYDPVGRVNSMTRDLGTTAWDNFTTFQYNPASQISQETRSNDAYLYTARANGTLSYNTNGLNQYDSVNGNAYCYDANGNLTADGQFVYLYDVENRLVEKRVQVNALCTSLAYSGTLQAKLRYDPLGRLYEVTGPATGKTRFLNDGDALVAEYDGDNGALLRRYVHGANGEIDDPIAWYEGTAFGSANVRLLYANQQGSIVAPVDTSGTPTRLFKYDEYGVAQASDNSVPATMVASNGARFLYTGQAWLPELGLYYYKARIYSPRLGRFMQIDPIGYEDHTNLYAYVGNDPVNSVDPDGKEVVYIGAPADQLELQAVLQDVAKSDPIFAERMQTMIDSKYIHTVQFTNPADPTDEPRNDFNFASLSDSRENGYNGVGIGSQTFISRSPVLLEKQGLGGSDIWADSRAQGSHEFFSHAFRKDQGIMMADRDKFGTRLEEQEAIRIENIYRKSLPGPRTIRTRHSPSPNIYNDW